MAEQITMVELMSDRQLFDAYGQVRGVEADREWAVNASYELREEQHVSPDRAHDALADQLLEFRDMMWHHDDEDHAADHDSVDRDAPANQLFGTPRQWAARHANDWREDGIDAFDDRRPQSWRSAVIDAFNAAACAYVALWALLLVNALVSASQSTMSWTKALIPSAPVASSTSGFQHVWTADGMLPLRSVPWPLLCMLIVGITNTVVKRIVRNVSYVLAVLIGGVMTIGGAIAAAMLTERLAGSWLVPIAWMLPTAAVCALAGRGIAMLWPDRTSKADEARKAAAHSPLVDDATWLRETGSLLRERGDITDRQVARILDDAQAHARQSGADLAAEFGTPAEYAHRFRITSVGARRELVTAIVTVIPMTAIVVAACWGLISGGWSDADVPVIPLMLFAIVWLCTVANLVSTARAYWLRRFSGSRFFGPQKS